MDYDGARSGRNVGWPGGSGCLGAACCRLERCISCTAVSGDDPSLLGWLVMDSNPGFGSPIALLILNSSLWKKADFARLPRSFTMILLGIEGSAKTKPSNTNVIPLHRELLSVLARNKFHVQEVRFCATANVVRPEWRLPDTWAPGVSPSVMRCGHVRPCVINCASLTKRVHFPFPPWRTARLPAASHAERPTFGLYAVCARTLEFSFARLRHPWTAEAHALGRWAWSLASARPISGDQFHLHHQSNTKQLQLAPLCGCACHFYVS
jgi:hypothetical protein